MAERYDRVIVTGTRDALSADDAARVERLLRRCVHTPSGRGDEWSWLGVGDCPTGVDQLVREMYPHARVFTADWTRRGKSAGPWRNGQLVRQVALGKCPIVLAFPSPTSKGTWNCARQAARLGVRVVVEPVGVDRG